jgi:hypothetical protein
LTPLGKRRVAGAGQHPYLRHFTPGSEETTPQFLKGLQQVASDIVIQGLERRDVQDPGVAQRQSGGGQFIDGPQKGGQGFPAAGGGRNQHVLLRLNMAPRLGLNIRGMFIPIAKPLGNDRVKPAQRIYGCIVCIHKSIWFENNKQTKISRFSITHCILFITLIEISDSSDLSHIKFISFFNSLTGMMTATKSSSTSTFVFPIDLGANVDGSRNDATKILIYQ